MTMNRIGHPAMECKLASAEEAAALIRPGMTLGVSGFTLSGYPKLVPQALARRGEAGEKLRLTVISGASVGDELDGAMTRAGIIARRYPYQSNRDLRDAINAGEVAYVDIHLSQLPLWVRSGVFGAIDYAIVEASSIDGDGIVPTTSVGSTNALVQCAKHVIVELNTLQSESLRGLHDVYTPELAPNTEPIPIRSVRDHIGTPYIPCTPDKIAAIVLSDVPDQPAKMPVPDAVTQRIAKNLVTFLQGEIRSGRLPERLPPLQSGVGGIGNAILLALAESSLSGLELYSEVLQDGVLDMLDRGVVDYASGSALSLTAAYQKRFAENLERYRGKMVLRPQEISNSPEVIRRLGVIAVNTAIEIDLSGNVNSTHIDGDRMMNGIGGSGDYARNAGVTIFVTPATARNGALSCVVPCVAHIDHTEHDVDVVITEYGTVDLRGLTAYERAEKLTECCAAPEYRDILRDYMRRVRSERRFYHGIPFLAPEGGI